MTETDIADIIAIVFGILGFLTSIITVLYTRSRISLLKKEAEKKKTFEQTSQAAREARDMTKKSRIEVESADPIYFDQENILSYMHDNKLSTLTVNLTPTDLYVFMYDDKKKVHIKEAKQLIDILSNGSGFDFNLNLISLDFISEPDIFQNNFLDMRSIFTVIQDYYTAYNKLKPYEHIIRAFDDTLLADMKNIIDDMVKTLFENLNSKHQIGFNSTDTTKQILNKLCNGWLGKREIENLVWRLFDLCDTRLVSVEKDSFFRG